MQRTMKSAVPLVTVYGVKPFWSFVVTLALFGVKSSSANRNEVCMQDVVASVQQQKFVFGLEDENFANSFLWRSVAAPKTKCDACHSDDDDNSYEGTFHFSTLHGIACQLPRCLTLSGDYTQNAHRLPLRARSRLLGSWCHNSEILPKLALVHAFFSSGGELRFLRMDSPPIYKNRELDLAVSPQ